MKKYLLLLPLLVLMCSAGAHAQCPTQSPNIGFQIPNVGNTTTWGICLNQDLAMLDTILGGIQPLPPGTVPNLPLFSTNYTTANATATVITNFTGGFPGMTLRIICGDSFTSMTSNATLALSGGWSCPSGVALTLVKIGTVWTEVGRGGGAGAIGPAGPTGPPGTVGSNTGATIGGSLTAKGPAPWIDATAYGMVARTTFQTTTATTNGTSAVTLAGAIDYVNGDGIVIWKAGSATSQLSTPVAPTVTSPAVQGNRTINYEIVGVDSMGGLTAASPAGSVANAPTSMGDQPVQISSMTQTAGTVSVVLASPMPRLAPGLQITVTNEDGAHTVDGVFPVVTSSDTSHFTYALAGNAGSIAIGVYGAWARIGNTFNISSITRSGTTITITTNQNHGFQVQSGGFPFYTRTIAVVQGVAQAYPPGPTNDMNGEYVVLSASGNTLTLDTPISSTETGDVTGTGLFQPTVTVYEYVVVQCPQITSGSHTVAYYIYADYANNGSYILIGKTLPGYPGQSVFYDYGPWQGGAYTTLYQSPNGYVAPGYVPTTPPNTAQAQLYVGTISSGAGGTSIVVDPPVPGSGSGFTAMHDESSAIKAAIAAAQAVGGGSVLIAPAAGKYVINAPIQFPTSGYPVDIKMGGSLIVNETISTGAYSSISAASGLSNTTGLSFSRTFGPSISGLASPQISSVVDPTSIHGIAFFGTSSASQTSLYAAGNGAYGLDLDDDIFAGGQYSVGTSVPVVIGGISGITAEVRIRNSEFIGFFNGLGNGFFNGGSTINIGPNIPTLWLRGNDDNSSMPEIYLEGENIFAGRGIFFDGTYGQAVGGQYVSYYEYQAPATPTVMYYATAAFGGPTVTITNGNNDSQPGSIFANWSPYGVAANVILDGVFTSGLQSLVTGSRINGLIVKGSSAVHPIGQNSQVYTLTNGTTDVGAGTGVISEAGFGMPLIVTGPTDYPVGNQIPQVTGVSATPVGGGSIPAGTYQITVSAVGWNGGANIASPVVNVTVNGSQNISVNWAPSLYVRGYNVYLNGQGQNYAGIIPVGTNSFTISLIANSGSAPSIDGTGMPFHDRTHGTWSPLYGCPERTAPSGLTAADIDYCDSTLHRKVAINNNGSSVAYTLATDMPLTGSTISIGGGLSAGQCDTGTASVTGATTSMTVTVTPQTYPGDGFTWGGYVSSAGTVTVKVCAIVTGTPVSSVYTVRVVQ